MLDNGLRGALFSPETNGWQTINTDGAPNIYIEEGTIIAWTGSELFLYGKSRTNSGTMRGGLYNPTNGTWRAVSTNNGPQSFGYTGNTRRRAIWTGTELVGYVQSGDPFNSPSRFHAYNPQSDTWRPCSTKGMPPLEYNPTSPTSDAPNLFWTGSEIGMVFRQITSVNPTTVYKTAVYLYQPQTDSWRAFLTDFPTIEDAPLAPPVITPHWTGSEALVYLTVPYDSPGPIYVWRPFRFTPPKTLYFYQKP